MSKCMFCGKDVETLEIVSPENNKSIHLCALCMLAITDLTSQLYGNCSDEYDDQEDNCCNTAEINIKTV